MSPDGGPERVAGSRDDQVVRARFEHYFGMDGVGPPVWYREASIPVVFTRPEAGEVRTETFRCRSCGASVTFRIFDVQRVRQQVRIHRRWTAAGILGLPAGAWLATVLALPEAALVIMTAVCVLAIGVSAARWWDEIGAEKEPDSPEHHFLKPRRQ